MQLQPIGSSLPLQRTSNGTGLLASALPAFSCSFSCFCLFVPPVLSLINHDGFNLQDHLVAPVKVVLFFQTSLFILEDGKKASRGIRLVLLTIRVSLAQLGDGWLATNVRPLPLQSKD